jgi:predicted nucleotidyltransferase
MTMATRYQLPFGSATQTPHTTERCWRTANQNLILLTEVGSNLHGTAVGGDDRDMQGVCIEPPEVMLGVQRFELYEYRTQPQGQRSGEGDIDLSVYGLAKWVRLIINGNPSHLLPLFAPDNKVYAITGVGRELRENRNLFLARDHANRFLGYLNRQRERMLGNLSQRTNRPELIEKYGYDTKFAAHALRIAMQGIELMKTGEMTLPMPPFQRRYLTDVRLGKYTQGEVLAKLGSLESDLMNAAQYSTTLPDRVDMDYVNDWLVGVYQRHWEECGS